MNPRRIRGEFLQTINVFKNNFFSKPYGYKNVETCGEAFQLGSFFKLAQIMIPEVGYGYILGE